MTRSSGSRELHPMTLPETAASGYFVHARYLDEQLMTPEAGEFYVELETALAVGVIWLNQRHAIDPKTLLVSGLRQRNREIIAMALRLRGVPRCGILIARSDFEAPPREKPLKPPTRWWSQFFR